MANLREKFGNRLRTLRQEKGVTQKTLAKKAEIDQTYPSKIEHGLRAASLDTIERLAEVLNVEPKELFEFDDQ